MFIILGHLSHREIDRHEKNYSLLQQIREGDRGSEGLGSSSHQKKLKKDSALIVPACFRKQVCLLQCESSEKIPVSYQTASYQQTQSCTPTFSILFLACHCILREQSPEHPTSLVWLWKKQCKTPAEVHSVPNYISKYQHVYSHVDLTQHSKCLKRRKVVYFQLISFLVVVILLALKRRLNSAAGPQHGLGFAFVFALVIPVGLSLNVPSLLVSGRNQVLQMWNSEWRKQMK